MPTDPQQMSLGEKVFMECTKARDCLSRARDGIPDTLYDASQLTYTRDQLNRAYAYVASAQMAVDAMSAVVVSNDGISGISERVDTKPVLDPTTPAKPATDHPSKEKPKKP